jgi:hypothetical protein
LTKTQPCDYSVSSSKNWAKRHDFSSPPCECSRHPLTLYCAHRHHQAVKTIWERVKVNVKETFAAFRGTDLCCPRVYWC